MKSLKIIPGSIVLFTILLFASCNEEDGKGPYPLFAMLPGAWQMVTATEKDLNDNSTIELTGSNENRMYYLFSGEEHKGYIVYNNSFIPFEWDTEGQKLIKITPEGDKEEIAYKVIEMKMDKELEFEFTTANKIYFRGKYKYYSEAPLYNVAGEWKLRKIEGWQDQELKLPILKEFDNDNIIFNFQGDGNGTLNAIDIDEFDFEKTDVKWTVQYNVLLLQPVSENKEGSAMYIKKGSDKQLVLIYLDEEHYLEMSFSI